MWRSLRPPRLRPILVLILLLISVLPAASQSSRVYLPGKWKVALYGRDPRFLAVAVDMRSARRYIRVLGVRCTATLYAAHDKFLKQAVVASPQQTLTPGHFYVFYARHNAGQAVKAIGISSTATIQITSEPAPLPTATSGRKLRTHPGVPLQYDAKIRIPDSRGRGIIALNSPSA